jgi:hypothetical protein
MIIAAKTGRLMQISASFCIYAISSYVLLTSKNVEHKTCAGLILQDRPGNSKDGAAKMRVAGILRRLTLANYRLPSAIRHCYKIRDEPNRTSKTIARALTI